MKNRFEAAVDTSPLLLTEGAVGQRLEREYGLAPDEDIAYAGLLYDARGRAALREIYRGYMAVAREENLPLMLLTNTRRVNRDRHARSRFADVDVIGEYVAFLRALAEEEADVDVYIGGMMGCKGDAYTGENALGEGEAESFHGWAVERFARAGVDFLYAAIMPTLPEIMGMARVMAGSGLSYIVSLMIGRDGRLPDGCAIDEAIRAVDEAVEPAPVLYMTNCVHPAIAEEALMRPFNRTERVARRFAGIQANAACIAPEELDGSEALMSSEPEVLAEAFRSLNALQRMRIVGGCCGTDERHLRAVAKAMK